MVAGGVPCQPWSLGGVHKGYDDDRNLWPELFRCVRETRPRAIIAENVKGLLRPSFKEYYDYILRELAAPFEERVHGEDWRDHDLRLAKALEDRDADPERRYDVKHLLVNAADYGVPQIRFRVFVVAFRQDLGLADWRFPAPTHSEAALLRDQATGRYWKRHKLPARPAPIPSPAARRGWDAAVADAARCDQRSARAAGAAGGQAGTSSLAPPLWLARGTRVPRPHTQRSRPARQDRQGWCPRRPRR